MKKNRKRIYSVFLQDAYLEIKLKGMPVLERESFIREIYIFTDVVRFSSGVVDLDHGNIQEMYVGMRVLELETSWGTDDIMYMLEMLSTRGFLSYRFITWREYESVMKLRLSEAGVPESKISVCSSLEFYFARYYEPYNDAKYAGYVRKDEGG